MQRQQTKEANSKCCTRFQIGCPRGEELQRLGQEEGTDILEPVACAKAQRWALAEHVPGGAEGHRRGRLREERSWRERQPLPEGPVDPARGPRGKLQGEQTQEEGAEAGTAWKLLHGSRWRNNSAGARGGGQWGVEGAVAASPRSRCV